MNSLEAVEKILSEVKEPLHYAQITNLIVNKEYWSTEGLTPDATINAKIAVDIKNKKTLSKFMRVEPGIYALREWGLEDFDNHDDNKMEKSNYSFNDAAELVLENYADKTPMHYRDITEKILELDLVNTQGKTPEATLNSQIATEIQRKEENNETPRFVQYGKGIIGLRKWLGDGLAYQIKQNNTEVKTELLNYLHTIPPQDFEKLIGLLLAEMGFEQIEISKYSGDGGIDVRGILVVGDTIRTKMAIQAKRWKNNIQSPIIQQVRGSLGAHEQGMIITTSDFSSGAKKEAERPDATPVALVNGEHLVELLIENEILVNRISYDLLSLVIEDE